MQTEAKKRLKIYSGKMYSDTLNVHLGESCLTGSSVVHHRVVRTVLESVQEVEDETPLHSFSIRIIYENMKSSNRKLFSYRDGVCTYASLKHIAKRTKNEVKFITRSRYA
jgi:hypothetical protein